MRTETPSQFEKKRTTVVLFSPVPPPMHGAAYAADLLLHSSFAERFEVTHINAKFVDNIRDLQSFTPKKAVLALRYWWQLVGAILGGRADVVILTPAFYPKPFLKDALYIWTAKLLGRNVVAWYHMNFLAMRYETLPGAMQWFIRRTLSVVDCHVSVGHSLVKNLPAFIERDRTAVVHNGIPAVRCNGEHEAEKVVRIVYLSNLGTAKGWRVLFTAAERLCERNETVRIDFYGNPMTDSPAEEIEQIFGTGQFPSRIVYHGPVYGADKERVLCGADIFCFPSLNEAFPLTVLEAMSAGLPVVASDVGSVREAVEDGRSGKIVSPGNIEALEAALQTLVDQPDVRREMGRYNRERFAREFTVEAYVERWCTLVERLGK